MFNINADGAKCLGCGVHFKGVQGRKVHQNKKFGSMGCRPIMVEAEPMSEVVKNVGRNIEERACRKCGDKIPSGVYCDPCMEA